LSVYPIVEGVRRGQGLDVRCVAEPLAGHRRDVKWSWTRALRR